MWLALVDEIS